MVFQHSYVESNFCLDKASKETVNGWQFDWGGRLLKGNGGAHKVDFFGRNFFSLKNKCNG